MVKRVLTPRRRGRVSARPPVLPLADPTCPGGPARRHCDAMKPAILRLLAAALCACLLTAASAGAATAGIPQPKSPPGTQEFGVEVAETLSMVTGIAISPLLGVSAVGAWKWARADARQRPHLPWFAQPYFWGPALALVLLVFLKDVLGTAAPTSLKKPLDLAEAVENKVSGLVAAGAVIPLLALFPSAPEPETASLAAAGFAALDFTWLYNLIMVPVALAAYLIVFLAANTINVLILICPFTTVDAALKSLRLAVLASVTVSALANPWVGACWALVVLLLASLIAGWSFRLTAFGAVLLWDFFSFRRHRYEPKPEGNRMFLARKTEKAPVRTYGVLRRDAEGRLEFTYRPWLLLPRRALKLPAGSYAVGHGLLYSEVLRVEGDETRSVFTLPPRYRAHEEELAKALQLDGVRPVGLRAAFRWLEDFLGFRPAPQPAAT